MNKRETFLLLSVFALLQLARASAPNENVYRAHDKVRGGEPTAVIFDTDIWSDIDDMLALAMLNTLQDRHEIKLLAVTISTEDPWCAPYVNLVNTFYGHPQIPIGVVRDGMSLLKFRKRFPQMSWPVTRYTELLSERKASDGALIYPHQLIDGTTAPDAVSLLRKTLAAQSDGSVVMIQVGYSTNLARLLDSKADSSTPLDGYDLVARKVRLLSLMAGNFRQTEFQGKTEPKGAPEFNLLVDVPAAQKVFSSWPTPLVTSGFEIGLAMMFPGQSIARDFSYVENHPIAETYTTYCREIKATEPKIKRCPEDHDHATFDLTAVLYAARPDQHYFSLSAPGKITITDDGSSHFEEVPGGKQRYLIQDEAQRARALEAMILLASQPPTRNGTPIQASTRNTITP